MQKVQCCTTTTRATPAKRNAPSAAVQPPLHNDRCWQRKRDGRAKPVNIFVLPHDEPILLQIANVVKGRWRLGLEKQPADVRLEKPFPNIVRHA